MFLSDDEKRQSIIMIAKSGVLCRKRNAADFLISEEQKA